MGPDREPLIAASAVVLATDGLARSRRRARLRDLNLRRCEPPLPEWVVDALELYNAPFGGQESAECHG